MRDAAGEPADRLHLLRLPQLLLELSPVCDVLDLTDEVGGVLVASRTAATASSIQITRPVMWMYRFSSS